MRPEVASQVAKLDLSRVYDLEYGHGCQLELCGIFLIVSRTDYTRFAFHLASVSEMRVVHTNKLVVPLDRWDLRHSIGELVSESLDIIDRTVLSVMRSME